MPEVKERGFTATKLGNRLKIGILSMFRVFVTAKQGLTKLDRISRNNKHLIELSKTLENTRGRQSCIG